MFGGYDIFVLIVVFLAILTVFLGVKTVPQGYNSPAKPPAMPERIEAVIRLRDQGSG